MHAFQALLFLLLISLSSPAKEVVTYSITGPNESPTITNLGKKLHSGDKAALNTFWASLKHSGTPLIEDIPDDKDFLLVTFVWHGNEQTQNVVIFDGIAGFDAKDRMFHLENSDVWYRTYRVRSDARFAYNLSPNDSLQPFNEVHGDEAMRRRLAMLIPDPLNPRRCPTTFGAYGSDSSYVELPKAPPQLWESPAGAIARGRVDTTAIHSHYLNRGKKLWTYIPASFAMHGDRYPLLILFDGDRNVMWIPKVLDVLIAQRRIPPVVAVMTDDSVPAARRTELPCNPNFANFLAKELVPWARENLHATLESGDTIVAGSSFGGLAAVFAALQHPEVFGNVISLSGSFWWKPDGEKEREWLTALVTSSAKAPLHFYLEVGLMESYSDQIDSNRHMRDALAKKGYPTQYRDYDGGHSFLNWSVGIANGLPLLLGPKTFDKTFDK